MSNKGVALITGAGQGIGAAIALRLAADGFDVAVNDIGPNKDKATAISEEIKAKGRRSSVHIADVSLEDQVEQMIQAVVAEHSSLDVMVANAGTMLWASAIETKVEDFDRMLAVNVRGTFLCFKHAAKQMIAQGRGGRIIGSSSVIGKRGAPFMIAYSACKAAIRGMTQSLASELGQHKITVNSTAPGAIETPMLSMMDESFAKSTGGQPGDYSKMLKSRVPLGENGTPNDIASMVSYLASQEAHFITGQSISVNGGMFMD